MERVLAAQGASDSRVRDISEKHVETRAGRAGTYVAILLIWTVAGVFGVWTANARYAPEMYHSDGPRKIAEAFARGENYAVFDLNINIRKLRDEHIARLPRAPEVVVLGASHWQEAHTELVPHKRFYNAHVHRDYYEDMLGVTEMFVRHDRLPRQMIIAIRDNLFTPISNRQDHLWLPIAPYYQAMAKRLGIEPSSTWEMLPVKRWYEQLSLKMLLDNVARWHEAPVTPHTTHAKQSDTLDILLPGGSIVWSGTHKAVFTSERMEREAADFARRRFNDPPQIDPKGVETIDALLRYLKARGVEVFLAHPPFNPRFYDRVKTGPYMTGLRKVTELTRQLAQKYGYRVIGSFDPQDVGCEAWMYIDAEHSNTKCLGKLLNQYVQIDQRQR